MAVYLKCNSITDSGFCHGEQQLLCLALRLHKVSRNSHFTSLLVFLQSPQLQKLKIPLILDVSGFIRPQYFS